MHIQSSLFDCLLQYCVFSEIIICKSQIQAVRINKKIRVCCVDSLSRKCYMSLKYLLISCKVNNVSNNTPRYLKPKNKLVKSRISISDKTLEANVVVSSYRTQFKFLYIQRLKILTDK